MKLELLIYALLFSIICSAQKTYTVSGYIEDAASKERLIGVNVYIPGTTYGTSTNTFGFYSLTLPADKYLVAVSFVGYKTITDSIDISNRDKNFDANLQELTEQLNTVEVTAEEIAAQQVRMSTVTLSAKEIKQIPAFLGEVDVIRALQLLPGVQSGGEGTTGLYVRGGSPDQNLILLDGVPVYNASHLFGFFSVFNADAIKNVELTKGGFPAQYGGRLSSVLEIDLKEGNMKEFHGEGAIGLISSKLTLEGPIIKDKTSFMLSGRRMYYDLLIRPFLPDDIVAGYYFGDFNVKVNHIFSRKDRLYLSFYGGEDNFYARDKGSYTFSSSETGGPSIRNEYSSEAGMKWGNRTGSLRWNHLYSSKLFSNLTATYTRYKFSVHGEEEDTYTPEYDFYQNSSYAFEYFSLIEDYGLKYDLNYSLNSNHTLSAGASYTYHTFRPGAVQISEDFSEEKIDSLLEFSKTLYANDLYTYIQDDWIVNNRLRFNYGLHYSTYFVNKAFYQSLQPRISGRYLFNDSWSFKGSYALMNQYIHLLSNAGLGLPTDLWVSSTDKIKPQFSQQIALGTAKNIQGNKYEISSEVYYKWMKDLIAYKNGASFVSTSDWQQNVVTGGKGWTYGLELLFRKKEGNTTGWIGYTLAWSNRQFEELNFDEIYPYKYDRRHDISVVVSHKFTDRFNMGLTWVYGTGNTFTAPVSDYYLTYQDYFYNGGEGYGGSQTYTQYTSRNDERFPAYHRMDISFNFVKPTRWGERIWNISFYNAYSRNNPFYVDISQDDQGNPQAYQVSLFPIIPAFSYIFKF